MSVGVLLDDLFLVQTQSVFGMLQARLEKDKSVGNLTCAVTASLTTGFSLPRCMNFICRSRLLKAGFFAAPSALPSAMTGQCPRQLNVTG